MPARISFLFICIVFLLMACPKPAPPDPVTCEEGYHACGEDLQECCLDTTSSEFTWIIDSLGLYGSELFDAAVISQDDIWVVGIIYLPEIVPPDTVWDGWEREGYNAGHWDGTEWSFYEVYDLAVIDGVFALGHNDIWFATGCTVVHYDGQSFERLWYCDYEQFGFNQTTTV